MMNKIRRRGELLKRLKHPVTFFYKISIKSNRFFMQFYLTVNRAGKFSTKREFKPFKQGFILHYIQ